MVGLVLWCAYLAVWGKPWVSLAELRRQEGLRLALLTLLLDVTLLNFLPIHHLAAHEVS